MSAPSTSGDLWIRRFPVPARGDVLLVCFPFAGGAAGWFRPLASLLAPGVEVRAVQYPGRQDRYHEPVVEDIPRLADLICDALEPALDRPFAFFGHSMGAVVAFEVTRRLALRDRPRPRVLVVSGRRAPSLRREERVHLRDDPGLLAELRALGGTDAAVLADDELVRMILPAVRGDYRAIETYRLPEHDAVVDVPVHALTGDADPRASVDEVAAWREHTTGDFSLHVLPGGHFFPAQQSARVADLITASLATHA